MFKLEPGYGQERMSVEDENMLLKRHLPNWMDAALAYQLELTKRYHHNLVKQCQSKNVYIDSRWVDSLENFIWDMGLRPGFNVLDKKYWDQGYDKKNCTWKDKKEDEIILPRGSIY